jgi:hypothetical protein
MGTSITITAGDVSLASELNDSATARAVADALPLSGSAKTWGDEIYFSVPLELDAEPDARAEMGVGELAYWPEGRALCIFFGPTPASGPDGGPRAVGPVNPTGRLRDGVDALRSVADGTEITVAPAG